MKQNNSGIFFLVLILIVNYSLLSFSQDEASGVSSKIVIFDSSSQQPIPFANICFKEIETGKRYYKTTPKQGGVDNPIQEKAIVVISFIGYNTIKDTLLPGSSKKYFMKQDFFNMNQVVITGTRTPKRLADAPVQTMVIRESEILKSGATSSIEVLSDYVPGIVTTPNAMGNNLRIRGLNSRYILFLVDGERLVSEGAAGNINLDQINFNNIERIEVVYGAASALYGSDAVGAVVNIITKKPEHSLEGEISSNYQSFNTSKSQVSIGSKINNGSFVLSAFRNSSDGYKIEDGARSNPYLSYGGSSKIFITRINRIKIDLTARAFQNTVYVFPSEKSRYNYTDDMERKLTLIGNTTFNSKNKKNILKASVNFDKFFKYELNDVVSENIPKIEKQPHITNLTSRLTDTYFSDKKLEIIGGVEHNFQQINTFSSTVLGEPNVIKEVNDINLFAQMQYNLTKNLESVLGARYTWNETFNSSFNPKLSLMYKLERFTFRASSGTAFRSPSLKELYYDFYHAGGGGFQVIGNPKLKAERGFYNSLSAEYTKRYFNFSVSGYYNQINNKIGQNMVEEINSQDTTKYEMNRYYVNTNSATIIGADVNISYVAYTQVILKGTYNYCNAVDNETGLPLPSSINHSGVISATWEGKFPKFPFSIQINGRVNSSILKQELINSNDLEKIEDESTKPYNIWKATFTKPVRINQHLIEITLKCDNIFGFEDDYFINPGRTYLAGIRYKFR